MQCVWMQRGAADVLMLLSCSFSSNRSTVRAGEEEVDEESAALRGCGCDMRMGGEAGDGDGCPLVDCHTVSQTGAERRGAEQQLSDHVRGDSDCPAGEVMSRRSSQAGGAAAISSVSDSNSQRSSVSCWSLISLVCIQRVSMSVCHSVSRLFFTLGVISHPESLLSAR